MSDDQPLPGPSGSESSGLSDSEVRAVGVKLKIAENLQAYLDERELLRDEHSVPCESKLAEKVVTNYIIAKNILSHVCWQEKLIFKNVCTSWRSAVNALSKEQMYPVDFMYDLKRGKYGSFKKSRDFTTEPLAVLLFTKMSSTAALHCKDINPPLCKRPCEDTLHSILDVIQVQACFPKTCMLSVTACSLTYYPLPNPETKPFCPGKWGTPLTFFSGVSIPVIPGVRFHVVNVRQTNKNSNGAAHIQADFYTEIEKIAQDHIIKGALVFITDKYLLQTDEDITLLNCLKQVQPDIPFALGGCLIEDTLCGERDLDLHVDGINTLEQYISRTLISVALFSVLKNPDESEKFNFDMFSLVILSSEWSKEKIKNAIDEFSMNVPHFQYSVAFKLSCVGRDKKHVIEQELFRQAFPDTLIIGCYGNGEIGLNHPIRPGPFEPERSKKRKVEERQCELLYSYSTVFVYMGWGRMGYRNK